jgi:hypothetical protein
VTRHWLAKQALDLDPDLFHAQVGLGVPQNMNDGAANAAEPAPAIGPRAVGLWLASRLFTPTLREGHRCTRRPRPVSPLQRPANESAAARLSRSMLGPLQHSTARRGNSEEHRALAWVLRSRGAWSVNLDIGNADFLLALRI